MADFELKMKLFELDDTILSEILNDFTKVMEKHMTKGFMEITNVFGADSSIKFADIADKFSFKRRDDSTCAKLEEFQ